MCIKTITLALELIVKYWSWSALFCALVAFKHFKLIY